LIIDIYINILEKCVIRIIKFNVLYSSAINNKWSYRILSASAAAEAACSFSNALRAFFVIVSVSINLG
jgi:hypothetical protein